MATKPGPWSRAEIPDLTGKISIVTGGTGGIGYETAIGLAAAGAEVTILGRNEEKGKKAVESMKVTHPKAKVTFARVDLGSLVAIKEFARTFNDRGVSLDILVNNAGLMAPPTRVTTMDGFEALFGTNHLAPFALTAQLLPSLMKSSSPRVINVSSGMANMANMDFDDLQCEKKKYSGVGLYAQSKLANLLFTLELQRRSDTCGWGLTVIAVHPGLVKTDMTAVRPGNDSFFTKLVAWTLMPLFSQDPDDGGATSLFAATSPEAKCSEFYAPNGFLEMYGPPKKSALPNTAKDLNTAIKLWEISEQLTNVTWPS